MGSVFLSNVLPDGWASPGWLGFAVCAGVVALAALTWSWSRRTTSSATVAVAAIAKALALLLLVTALLEPIRRDEIAAPQDNVVAVLVDRSYSTAVSDEPNNAAKQIADSVDTEAAWLTGLSETFDVRLFSFGQRIRSMERGDTLAFDARKTDLSSALAHVRTQFANQRVAGVVVLTDGRLGGEPITLEENSGGPMPLFPVVFDDTAQKPEVRIESVKSTQTNFEAAPVTVVVRVAWDRLNDDELTVQLRSASGEVVGEQTVAVTDDSGTSSVRFEARTDAGPVHFFEVVAFQKGQSVDAIRDEVTPLNNRRQLVVNRAGGPYRLLYVSGRPNWEFKYLRRALEEDEEVRLTGLIRIAKKKPKFSFREVGSEANTLFKGFDADQEVTEQYDEPVLLRVGTVETDELRGGFPKTAEELFAYHGIVIDDLEAAFFSEDQKQLVHDFVARRGGGLVMLGGLESFQGGKYDRTPIGDLLPVYVDRAIPSPAAGEARMSLSRDGLLEPWLRLRQTVAAEANRLESAAGYRTTHALPAIKPGATVLTEISGLDSEGGRYPGLVTHRFGKGRAAALAVGDYWRTHMRRNETTSDDFMRSWRQISRWLISDVPQRVSIEVDDSEATGDSVGYLVRVFDREFQPLNNARVDAALVLPDGERMSLRARAIEDQSGQYRVVVTPDVEQSGNYVVEINVTDYEGEVVGTAANGFTFRGFEDELASLTRQTDVFAALASQTGGQVVGADSLPSLTALLSEQPHVATQAQVVPLWHRWTVLTLIVALLGLEWGVRRWKGMP